MALKTLHFVQGLSRTPLLFIPRYLTNIFSKIFSKKKISRIENLEIWKSKSPGSLTGAQNKVHTGSAPHTTPPHPTPPNPTPPWRFRKSNVMAFPFNVIAFPVTGLSHGLAAAPGHGQVALGAKKVARGPHSGPPQGRATFFVPSATWQWSGVAARPWESPVTGNAITLNGNAQ